MIIASLGVPGHLASSDTWLGNKLASFSEALGPGQIIIGGLLNALPFFRESGSADAGSGRLNSIAARFK